MDAEELLADLWRSNASYLAADSHHCAPGRISSGISLGRMARMGAQYPLGRMANPPRLEAGVRTCGALARRLAYGFYVRPANANHRRSRCDSRRNAGILFTW